jgi:1-acyl-sn-glycerol-3-phosphate acyltransferase
MQTDSRASEWWYKFNFVTMYLTYSLLWSFRSEGSRNVPQSGPVLVLANHESFLDPVAIGIAMRRRIWYLARKTLFKEGFFGKYLESVGCISVDQEGVAKEGLRASLERLQAGKALLIFPEGERTLTGQMLPFKPGIALVLRKMPVPILPVGVAGAYEAYPRAAKLPRFSPPFWPATGASVAVSIGEPIPPERYQSLGREELLTFLFEKIRAQVGRAEKMIRKPG